MRTPAITGSWVGLAARVCFNLFEIKKCCRLTLSLLLLLLLQRGMWAGGLDAAWAGMQAAAHGTAGPGSQQDQSSGLGAAQGVAVNGRYVCHVCESQAGMAEKW